MLLGPSWGRLGLSEECFGMLWESLGVLFDVFSWSKEVFEAKTAAYSKMTYLTALLLCFWDPKASKMRSKSSQILDPSS